jgi:phage shock protein B
VNNVRASEETFEMTATWFLLAIVSLLLVCVGLPVLLLVLVFSGRRNSAGVSEDQARLLEQTWLRLGRMEDRLTNLESILLESSAGPRRTDS